MSLKPVRFLDKKRDSFVRNLERFEVQNLSWTEIREFTVFVSKRMLIIEALLLPIIGLVVTLIALCLGGKDVWILFIFVLLFSIGVAYTVWSKYQHEKEKVYVFTQEGIWHDSVLIKWQEVVAVEHYKRYYLGSLNLSNRNCLKIIGVNNDIIFIDTTDLNIGFEKLKELTLGNWTLATE